MDGLELVGLEILAEVFLDNARHEVCLLKPLALHPQTI